MVELRHGPNAEHASRWLQVSHTFQPSVPRLEVQLEQTTVSLAFSLEGEAPTQQQVYAFLPLRSYGLSFIVQVSLPMLHPVLILLSFEHFSGPSFRPSRFGTTSSSCVCIAASMQAIVCVDQLGSSVHRTNMVLKLRTDPA